MPTGKTITADEAGVLLPGMQVECAAGAATVIVPSADAMVERPSDTAVFVRLHCNGAEVWVEQAGLKNLRQKI